MIKEGKIAINVGKGVFYNPRMEINRDLVSASLSCLNAKTFCDGHSATGIKVLRAKSENECVESADAVDLSERACENIEKNIKLNKISGVRIINNDIRIVLMKNNYDFVEIDPFGSPAPYFYALAESFSWRREGAFSITATDTAVLCGAEAKACRRIYGSAPMHGEIVHEIGLRILISSMQKVFAGKNIAIRPLFSISHRHYLKIFFKAIKKASMCDNNLKQIAYFAYCNKCKNRRYINIGESAKCNTCSGNMLIAGPLWTGLMNDNDFLNSMLCEIESRNYKNGTEEMNIIRTVKNANFHGYCYDIHKTLKGAGGLPKTNTLINELRERGYRAEREQYKNWIIRTDAGIEELKKAGKSNFYI